MNVLPRDTRGRLAERGRPPYATTDRPSKRPSKARCRERTPAASPPRPAAVLPGLSQAPHLQDFMPKAGHLPRTRLPAHPKRLGRGMGLDSQLREILRRTGHRPHPTSRPNRISAPMKQTVDPDIQRPSFLILQGNATAGVACRRGVLTPRNVALIPSLGISKIPRLLGEVWRGKRFPSKG